MHFLRFLFADSDDEDENNKKSKRRRTRERVSAELAEVASSYGLVRFQPLVVTDERLIKNVISQVKYINNILPIFAKSLCAFF